LVLLTLLRQSIKILKVPKRISRNIIKEVFEPVSFKDYNTKINSSFFKNLLINILF
jgi:hypothetical protein